MARHAGRAKTRDRTSRSVFPVFLAGLVLVFLLTLAVLVLWGGSYYATPLVERATHPLYALLKPSGLIGRSLGIAGTVMMLLIFLYSVRKKSTTLQRFGTQAQWLKVHIFLGIAGPVLVTFHTSGKLNGVVAIAFYSMWAMVLSGVVGRYLYAKIPRTISGNQMTLNEIESELTEMVNLLRESERREEVLSGITSFLGATRKGSGGLFRTLGRVLRDDAGLLFAFLRVFAIVSRDRSLHFGERLRVSRLVLRQKRLLNKLAVLDAMKRLFSYWHIFHKPFTVITFVIVFLHVGIAVYLGYGLRW
jgi:hypothetical protein